MDRWMGVCMYDGTSFYGFQSQKGGNTIQDELEARLKKIFKTCIRVHGSARTDAGVHANGQVFHFDASWAYGENTLLKALGVYRPGALKICSVSKVPMSFHARYTACSKVYIYRVFMGTASPFESRYIWSLNNRYNLDLLKMQEAAKILIGKHDFSAFGAKSDDPKQKENPVKNLMSLDVVQKGLYLNFYTQASGYLYKMVRSLVGVLIEVGLGRLEIAEVKAILDSRCRTSRVVTAPPHGLFLEKVFYE